MTQYELIIILVAVAALGLSIYKFASEFKCQLCDSKIIRNYGDAYTWLCKNCSNSEAGVKLMMERQPIIDEHKSLETKKETIMAEQGITMEDKTIQQTFPLNFEQLRILFIIGCLINIVLFFVPSAKVRGFFGSQESLSNLDAVKIAFQTGQADLGLLFVAFFGAMIAFLVLALTEQKRWVFIAGASVSAFFILLELFSPSNPNIEYLWVPRIVGWIGSIFLLLGFFAKPPELAAQAPQ